MRKVVLVVVAALGAVTLEQWLQQIPGTKNSKVTAQNPQTLGPLLHKHKPFLTYSYVIVRTANNFVADIVCIIVNVSWCRNQSSS